MMSSNDMKILGLIKREADFYNRIFVNFAGRTIAIETKGIGSKCEKLERKIQEAAGKYDAICLDGIDLCVYIGNKKYITKGTDKLISLVQKTPLIDGKGLKNILQPKIGELLLGNGIDVRGKNAFIIYGIDNYSLAKSLEEYGCKVHYGDYIVTKGIPVKSAKGIEFAAWLVFGFFKAGYDWHKNNDHSSLESLASNAQFIVGDIVDIKKCAHDLKSKIIITDYLTKEDLQFISERSASYCVTLAQKVDNKRLSPDIMEGILVGLGYTPNIYGRAIDKHKIGLEFIDLQKRMAPRY